MPVRYWCYWQPWDAHRQFLFFQSWPNKLLGIRNETVCLVHEPLPSLFLSTFSPNTTGGLSATALSLFDTCIHIFWEISFNMQTRRTPSLHAGQNGLSSALSESRFWVRIVAANETSGNYVNVLCGWVLWVWEHVMEFRWDVFGSVLFFPERRLTWQPPQVTHLAVVFAWTVLWMEGCVPMNIFLLLNTVVGSDVLCFGLSALTRLEWLLLSGFEFLGIAYKHEIGSMAGRPV